METSKSLLTAEDCTLILKKHVSRNCIYKSHLIKVLSSLNGLVGRHSKLKILYDENGDQTEIDLFLKELPTTNAVLKYLTESIKAYEKEEFYYKHLLKEFKFNNIDVNFAPTCYLCRPSIFVMEDLSLRGYRNVPAKDMLDVKHCKVALKSLAKFHTATLLYEKIKSTRDSNCIGLINEFPQFLDDTVLGSVENAATQWLDCTLKGLLALIDLLPQAEVYAEEYKIKLIEALEMSKNSEQSAKHVQTVLHGDLWSNNFMFKYNNNGQPIDSILIDYQILKYGPLAEDVVQMILTNVRRTVRSVHFEELLSYYYHQFSECVEGHGFQAIDFFSYGEFLKSCEDLKVSGKILSVADHSITFLMNEEFGEAIKTEEGFRKILLENRSESMVKMYNEGDIYHEIMTEDLLELRDFLFQT